MVADLDDMMNLYNLFSSMFDKENAGLMEQMQLLILMYFTKFSSKLSNV